MKFSAGAMFVFSAFLLQVSARPGSSPALKPRRTSSLLINPDPQPDLPSASSARTAAAAASLNLDDIQGDILIGMKKKKELFFFFGISNVTEFKARLRSDIHPLITTTNQLLSVSTQPITALNIAFSFTGLNALGVTDSLLDTPFENGQFSDAGALGDPGTGNWVAGLAGTSVHGVFLLASDTLQNIDDELDNLLNILGDSVTEIHRLQGEARPGSQEGHEHFGYMDGISQPAVDGFTTNVMPGQSIVQPGVFLLGEDGDTNVRPSWAKGGSFLAFRQLKQLVPEFNKFLTDNPLTVPGLTTEQNSDLLGARMIGRWKSGAPVDLAPLFDDPVLAADPTLNNDFTFEHPGESLQSNQTRCPFSAHIRKTRPRADFNPANTRNQIIRAGIPYGPEVTDEEATSGQSDNSLERGLAFVSYQASLDQGFRFMQQVWVNNANFIFGKSDPTPGVDPIIGALAGAQRPISGLDPLDATHDITLQTDFVVSRGGEYFFSPPLSAILDPITA
nr:DyP-type peroxidase [Chondrostereum purpureum]